MDEQLNESTVEPIAEPISEPVVEPTIEPVHEPVREPYHEPVSEPTVEPKKKDGSGLWKGLAGLFFIIAAVLAFLYLTKKDTYSVVYVNTVEDVKVEKVEKGSKAKKVEILDDSFLGWYLDDTEFNFETKIEKDYVLYAKYDNRKEYTVTFNTDGGSEIAPVKVKENSKLSEPTKPTKAGLIFSKWMLDGAEYDFNTPVTKDITLKATWMENDNKVAVHFDSAGGSKVADQRVGVGATAKKPNNPTRTGFNFKEWQLNGVAYNFETPVNSEITLKATWTEKKKVTLSFNTDGGSAVASKTVYENEPVGGLSTPTKSGFVFARWDLNGATFNANSRISKDTTVKAIWKTVDQANMEKAKAAIKASYDITKSGQTIPVTSNGCTITHDPINLNGTSKITIVFHITCGTETGTKNATGNVKLPTYKCTYVPNDNMTNSKLTISGVNSGDVYSTSGEWLASIQGGHADVNNGDLNGTTNLKMKISGDNTTYDITCTKAG